MAIRDISPDMGACAGIPDMGAWQFVRPDALYMGAFQSNPVISGKFKSEIVGTAGFESHPTIDGDFGAKQSIT